MRLRWVHDRTSLLLFAATLSYVLWLCQSFAVRAFLATLRRLAGKFLGA